MPEFISSLHNPRVKTLLDLASHPKKDAFLVEGDHLVGVAFEAGCLDEVYSLAPVQLPSIKGTIVSEQILNKICKSVSKPSIIGVCHLKENEGYLNKILILDRVQDPGNIGTLLRSAICFGFEDILFLDGSCSPLNSKVIASTEGAIFHARLHFGSEEEVKKLHANGYCIIGSALSNASPLESFALQQEKFALILGNEGQGMSSSLLRLSDINLKIDIHTMESLNVAIAGGILMHHFR